MSTTKKSTTNPEKATLSVKTGKRKQLANEMEKTMQAYLFFIQSFNFRIY